jgi:ribosomal protein L24E
MKGRVRWPVVVHDKKTFLTCDCCNEKHERVTFYELCSSTGKQVVVWYGTPKGWLLIIGKDGSPVYTCSKKCAKEYSSATRNKHFRPNLSKLDSLASAVLNLPRLIK